MFRFLLKDSLTPTLVIKRAVRAGWLLVSLEIFCPLLNFAKLRTALRHKSGTDMACHLLVPTSVPVAIDVNKTMRIKKRNIKLLRSRDK